MARKGRDLEKLVATLESIIGGKSIKLASPDYITGIKSHGRREIDVSLRSRVGTSEVLVIFECRNRKLKDDVTWIEQLAAKGKDVRASKVVAVSSSGFSASAKTLADQEGIELRSVDSLAFESITSWFPFLPDIEFTINRSQINLAYLQAVHAPNDDFSRIERALQEKIANSNGSTPILVRAKDGDRFTVTEIFNNFVQEHPSAFEGLEPGGEPRSAQIVMEYPDPEERFLVETEMGPVRIELIVFQVAFWVTAPIYPTPEAMQYARPGEDPLAQSVRYAVGDGIENFEFAFHKIEGNADVLFTSKSESSQKQVKTPPK